MLGACNTCVRLQSRVASSGVTVKSWMFFCFFLLLLIVFLFSFIKCLFYLFMYLFCTFSPLLVCFACFCFVAVDFFYFLLAYCVCVCAFKFIFFFPSLFILCAVIISLGWGIFCWSETKISYFGVVYKFLSVGIELAVIKELFIISYICDIYFLTSLFWFFYIYLFIDKFIVIFLKVYVVIV